MNRTLKSQIVLLIAALAIACMGIVAANAQDAPLNGLIRTDLDQERIAEICARVYAARIARAEAERVLDYRQRSVFGEMLRRAGVQDATMSCSLRQIGTVNSGSGVAVSYNWSDGNQAVRYIVTRAGISFTYPGNARVHSEVSGCSFSAAFTVRGEYSDGSTCILNSTGEAPHTAPCSDRNTAYQAVAVSSASYNDILAPGGIVTIFANNMTSQTATASSLPLPSQLGGVKVYVFKNTPLEQECGIFFASPKQVNVLLPPNMPAGGLGTIAVVNVGEDSLRPTWYVLNRNSPGIFTTSDDGHGPAKGYWVRDYLVLFGEGFNGAQAGFVLTGGARYPSSFVGLQGQFAGLYQANTKGVPRNAQLQFCTNVNDDARCSQVHTTPP